MKYKRPQYHILAKRIKSPRQFIQALTGPRQVGKTTIARQICNEIDIPYIYVTADNVADASGIWIEQQWEAARLKLKSTEANELLLIIDEIQKIKDWSSTVKELWDMDTFKGVNIKVVLLGSSGLMIQEGLNESLAGRYELIKVPHWSFNEMKECFGFSAEQYAWFGAYPGAADMIEDESRWKNYVKDALIEATISKDILMLVRIGKPALMRQLFELGIAYSSKILSYSKMLGQLQDAGNTTTIAHYLNLLDKAGLLGGIPKFYSETYRSKSSTPKWQVKNMALYAAMSSQSFETIMQDTVQWGAVVESAVGAHLINRCEIQNIGLYYWRHRNEEVDFVLRKGENLIAIEVKSGIAKATKGMATFKSKYNPQKVLLLGGDALSWQEFISMEPEELFH